MESRKILLGLLGLYLLVVVNFCIADGAIVETTTGTVASAEDIATESIFEIEPYTTPAAEEVTGNCKDYDQGVGCATKAPQESQTQSTEVNANEATTTVTAPNDDWKETTEASNSSDDSTTAGAEIGVTEESATTDSTPKGESEGTTGTPIAGEDTTTANNDTKTSEEVNTSSPNSGSVSTTDSSNTAGETTATTPPSTPPPACSTPAVQPHESDCRAYYDCSSSGSTDGSLQLLTKFCADNEAFSVLFGRCSRDISVCPNDVVCVAKGGLADPLSNNSYFLCEPRLIGGGFHVFHVKCSANEIFYPELGKCFVDFSNWVQPQYPAFPPYYLNQLRDIDLVKAELKLIKQHDKLQLKLEKDRIKAEQKLKKEAEKEAQRLAKEQEKLVKDQIKQESSKFVCQQAGNFPSQISDTVYYSCVVKKTKYKVILMKCPIGSKFSTDTGICVTSGTGRSDANADDESDDDDEYDD